MHSASCFKSSDSHQIRGGADSWLRSLSSDPRTARAFMGRVSVIVEGYDDDPRELFEIAAARSAGQAVTLALVLVWHVPRVRGRPCCAGRLCWLG